MTNLNERIKMIRKNSKLTQKQFGEKLSVSASYVSRLESGKEQPTEMLLKLIALTFDISTNWLEYGTGPIKINKNSDDYYERNNNEEYAEEFNQTVDILKQFIKDNPHYPMLSGLSMMFVNIKDMVALSNEQTINPLILEKIININLEIFNQLNFLFRTQNASADLNGETYKHLLLLSQAIIGELQDIGVLIENYGNLIT